MGERAHGIDPEAMTPELATRISSILEAVEREADRMLEDVRRQAEREIEAARRQADGLVAERQRKISELTDALVERAEVILDRLAETEPIRDSFDRLVQALGQAADRLTLEIDAGSPAPRPATAPTPPAPPPAPQREAPEDVGMGRVEQLHSPRRPYFPPRAAPAPEPEPEPEHPEAPRAARAGWESPPGEDPQLVQRARQAAIQMAAAGTTRAQVFAYLRDSLGILDTDSLLDEIFGPGTTGEARVPWAASS